MNITEEPPQARAHAAREVSARHPELESGPSEAASTAASARGGWLPRLAWLPIPILLLAIILCRAARLQGAYEADTLRLALSFAFYTLVALGTLLLMGRSFLAVGSPALLLLECGVLLWSLAGTVGDAVSYGDANIDVSIFNLGILLAGICHLLGAILARRPQRMLRAKRLWLAGGCALALGALWLVTKATVAGWVPVFFVPGQGGTLVRHSVLLSAICTFVLSAGLLHAGSAGRRSSFVSWYVRALLLLAVGLFGIMIQLSLWTAVNWLSRTAQWLGGTYLLIAALASAQESELPVLWPAPTPRGQGRYPYAVAVIAVLGAAAVRLVFLPSLGPRVPFVTLYPAVMAAALYGGWRAGLLATVLSVAVVDYFWIEPVGQFGVSSPADWLALAMLALTGALTCWVVEAMRRAQRRAQEAETRARIAKAREADLEALRQSEGRLAADLDAMTRLHKLGTVFVREGNLKAVLGEIVETAMAITGADFGNIQLLDESTGSLRIAAHRGFAPWWVDYWEKVTPGTGACGTALRRGERVIVEDVEKSPIFAGTPGLDVQLKAGVRAEQSTPLMTRGGKLLGILTTQWGRPHKPDEHDRWRIDLLVRQASDLIEQARAEAALAESERRFRIMADGTPLIIWVSDANGANQYVNQAYVEFFGVTAEEVEGQSWQALVHPEDQAAYVETVSTVTREHKRMRAQLRVRRHDGVWRWIEAQAEPRLGKNGEFLGMAGCCGDITEQKEFEAELQRLVAERTAELEEYRKHLEERVKQRTADLTRTLVELERSNRELEHFAYAASHDLQEPLRAVGGYVQLLAHRSPEHLDARARHYIQGAAEGAARMSQQILDLLELSRVGTRGLRLAGVNLGAPLRTALKNLSASIGEAEARVTTDPLPTLLVDGEQMVRLFQNLIGNSLKFRGEGRPEIHVGARREDSRWVMWVRDNGIGIDPQYFGKIFQVFQRLHTREKYPGTGVGLSICRRIVERHEGQIWVESQGGQGATFYFSLPGSGGGDDVAA